MKIKRYEGSTEKEAMLKVKEELGKEALIVSIKNIKPRGFYKIFKKPYVEVIAAIDEKTLYKNEDNNNSDVNIDKDSFFQLFRTLSDSNNMDNKEKAQKDINKELNIELRDSSNDNTNKNINSNANNNTNNIATYIKVIYEQLLENDLDEAYINQLMIGLTELSLKQGENIDDIVSIVYKRIVKLLSDQETIKLSKGKTKVVAFVGPTGVGKTTTIAKIASYFTLNLQKKVALITADTYRIAAVEQIRTYANILNIPVKVVYTPGELKEAIHSFKEMDLILIDTAGRSHKNLEHKNELARLLNEIEEKEIYLVLSLATRYKDLIKITNAYKDIGNFKLIFTKLDETSSYGNILNIKLKTNSALSYITFGQNVPDDISEINVHEIAKKILGGCES